MLLNRIIINNFRSIENLTIECGRGINVFAGVNGAGKSTLFKILTGELEPDEGGVAIAKNSRIGLISQIPVYPAGYTVEDALIPPSPGTKSWRRRWRN